MSLFTHSFVCAAALCAGPVLSITATEPVAGDVVLVIASPFSDIKTLVEQSGGRILGPETGAIGSLAISDNSAFFDELKEHGAWAVTDGGLLAQLCGVAL